MQDSLAQLQKMGCWLAVFVDKVDGEVLYWVTPSNERERIGYTATMESLRLAATRLVERLSTRPSEYPECDKIDAAKLVTIQEFLNFLDEEGIWLGEYRSMDLNSRMYPIQRSIDLLIRKFFGVDEAKREIELRAMVDRLRENNSEKT